MTDPRYGDSAADEVDLLAWAHVVLKRKRLAAAIVALTVAAFGALGLARPRVYEARAQVISGTPRAQAPASPSDPTSALSVVTDLLSGGRPQSNLTHAAAMRDPAVLDKALARLSPEDRASFRRYEGDLNTLPVKISPALNTDIIAVSVRSTSREAALALANAIVDTYAEYTQETNSALAREASSRLEVELGQVQAVLVSAEQALISRQRRTGIFDPRRARDAASDLVNGVRKEIADTRVSLAATEQSIQAAEEMQRALPEEIQASRTTKPGEGAKRLARGIADVQLEADRASAVFRPDSTRMKALTSQLDAARRSIGEVPESTSVELKREANPTLLSVDEQVASLKVEQAGFAERLRALKTELDAQNGWLDKVSKEEAEQNRLLCVVVAGRNSYDSVVSQMGALRGAVSARLSSVTPVGEATAPRVASRGAGTLLVTGFLVGVVLALLTVTAAEGIERRAAAQAGVAS